MPRKYYSPETEDNAASAASHGNSEIKRLVESVKQSQARLRVLRQARKTFINDYVGTFYFKGTANLDNSIPQELPVNSIHDIVNTLVHNMVSANPNPVVGLKQAVSDDKDLRFEAKKIEITLKNWAKEVKLYKTLRALLVDSFFGMGIAHIGVTFSKKTTSGENLGDKYKDEPFGPLRDPGQPYVEVISLDDFVLDANAKTFEEAEFIGHKYKVRADWARESGLYDEEILSKIKPFDEAYSHTDQKRTESISQYPNKAKPFSKYYEFIDLWIPYENRLVTINGNLDSNCGYLRDVEYIGPETGPYTMLGYNHAPDNAFPVPPVGIWYELSKLINSLMTKISRQAERSKDLLLVDETRDSQVGTIRDANDGEIVTVTDVKDGYAEVSFGGVNDKLPAVVAFLQDQQNKIAGNPQLLAGKSAQEKTLGQSQILLGGANVGISDMKMQLHQTTTEILEKVTWFLVSNPNFSEEIVIPIDDDYEVNATFSVEDMEGDLIDYSFNIEEFSMSPKSPEQRFEILNQIIQGVVAPFADIAASQGIIPDIKKLTDYAADMLDVDEIKDLWVEGVPTDATVREGETPQEETPDGRLVTNPEQEAVAASGLEE